MTLLSLAKQFAHAAKKSESEVVESKPAIIKPIEPVERVKATTPQSVSWQREDQLLIDWFISETDLPSEPFQLKQAVYVQETQKYYAWLRNDIAQGPHGPRARYGALQTELELLKRLVESESGNNFSECHKKGGSL